MICDVIKLGIEMLIRWLIWIWGVFENGASFYINMDMKVLSLGFRV